MSDIIKVQSLVKRYKGGRSNAVDDVTFRVQDGEFFTLLGPNGAGKTTIISILTTTLSPTSGQVEVTGHSLQRESAAIRRNVGIIFQHPSLDLNLTAEENVRFHVFLYGLYPFRPTYGSMPKDYRDQIQQLAEILGIAKEMFQPIKTFSGGMKRKLEILRSLVHRPKVLFLDEPSIGLDPSSRRNLWEYLSQVRRDHKTTIFLTTHYLEEAEEADTVCIINQGKIVALGTPPEIKAQLAGEYLLIDAGDRAKLKTELAKLGIAFEENKLIRIKLDGQNTYNIIKKIDTPLLVLKTHTPSLEDAYLRILGESTE